MEFLKITLNLALAVSVTLAVAKEKDYPTITCQYIRHDKQFEYDALEIMLQGSEIILYCTIPFKDSDNVRSYNCSLFGSREETWKGGSVSKTVRLDSPKPHERTKRQDNAEKPLYISEKKRAVQTGHTYHFPCSVVASDDAIADVVWFKGGDCDPKRRQLVLQHYNPPSGPKSILDPRYRFTDTGYGMIIESVNQTDSDRYWCKAYKESITRYVEDFWDLIVLGNTIPMHRWPNTVGDIYKITLNFEEKKLITCPVMSQSVLRQGDVTVYWSRLNTEEGQRLDIVSPGVGVASAVEQYSLDASNNLVVNQFNDREEEYCCHIFQDGADLRQSCVQVTWTAIQEQRYPVIAGCGDITTPEGQCDIKIESHQDFFSLECFVSKVYPRPEVSWSVTDCNGTSVIDFSTCDGWTYDNVSKTYRATSKLHLNNFPPASFSCNFICTSLGGAIANGGESSYVKLSRDKRAKSSCNCVLVFILTVIFVTLLIILVIGFCLVFPRNRRFIVKRINEMATFDCLVKDKEECRPTDDMALQMSLKSQSENTQNSQIERDVRNDEGIGMETAESSPMMSCGSGGDARDTVKGPVSLIDRTTPGISVTDKNDKWISTGQLVTGSATVGDVLSSGFEYIQHVIPTPGGGLIVIDTHGMHKYTSEYHYKFVHLNKHILGRYLCVAYFETNKLLIGLIMGKIVIFDIDKTEVSTFSFMTPVGDKRVELADISVDSQGFVFAVDCDGKAVSMFDPDGVCIKRVEINIKPVFLSAHCINEKKVSLFVSSENTVEMYSVDRKLSHYPYQVIMGAANTIIAEEDGFRLGGVFVRGDKLYVVNKLYDDRTLEVLQRDEASGKVEHRYTVAISDDEAATVAPRGIKGIVHAEEGTMLVYFEHAVYIFKSTENFNSAVTNEPLC